MITKTKSGSSEASRQLVDENSHSRSAGPILEALAATEPTTLAWMHGDARRGDAGALLREFARTLAA